MTVAELIEALSFAPRDAIVVYHGEQDWHEVEEIEVSKATRGTNGLWYRRDGGGTISAVRII